MCLSDWTSLIKSTGTYFLTVRSLCSSWCREREDKQREQREKQKERMRRYMERSLADSKKIVSHLLKHSFMQPFILVFTFHTITSKHIKM